MQVDLYSENVLDYCRNPRNKRALSPATFSAHDSNPSCGDELSFFVLLDGGGRVKDASFEGVGCAISIASAGMLTEAVKGKSLDELRAVDKDFVLKLLGVPVSAARVRCALLSLKVLKLGVYSYLGKKLVEGDGEFG